MSGKREHVESDKRERSRKIMYEAEISRFRVNNIRAFEKNFPFFGEPKEIGSFSLDLQRTFDHSRKQLKHYKEPPDPDHVSFDLKVGYSSMIRKDESKKSYIDYILRWILLNGDKFALQGPVKDTSSSSTASRDLHTDFVCWRGLLTKFLCTPYENREGWQVAVTLYNGTYYLCEFDTEDKIRYNANRTARDDEMCCWGWKFEQYLVADSPDSEPVTDCDFNNCEGFCTVVRSRLNTHSLVFSGEVDAINNKGDYVELKTSREISHPGQMKSFKRFKLIKWWAQSYLVGIPEVVCGYRDDDGVVHRLETFNTRKIPDIAKDIYNPWRPNVCFNFLEQLLGFIKHSIRLDDHRVVHLLQWKPGEDVSCTKLPNDADQFRFLPDWYINPSSNV